MTTLIVLLQSIPDVVWSGLLASTLTLGGVLLSNRSNTNRLLLQLHHDSLEKSKERVSALRREVYLRTAEELVKANAYLGTLTQTDLTKVNASEGLQPFFAAAARLQLVAEPKTALLVSQLVGSYGELFFKLLAELAPVQSAKSDIRLYDDMYSKAQAEVTRVLSEMAKINESGQRNDDAMRGLHASLEFQRGQAAQHADARSEAWDRFNKSQLTFVRFLLTQLRSLGAQQIPVLIETRRDLGLTTDIEALEAQMQVQWHRMETQLDALVTKLKAG